jgi:TonB family protein
MDLFTPSNIMAWSLQIALLTIAAASLPRLLKFDAPVIRHAYWRCVLALCLLLPLVQTWQTPPSPRASLRVDASPALLASTERAVARPASAPLAMEWLRTLQHTVNNIPGSAIAGVIGIGIAIKCGWLLLGIVRLRRMRRVGASQLLDDGVYDDVSALVQARADVRRVPGLGQPVTFGVWKPTVLVPDAFDRLPAGVRRAALAHELWHVRRRDWLWLMAEELLRAVFWFHPAIVWLVSQVQRSREEVVDELTVLLTNARRTYIETLLRFADETSVYPAAPIASRGHLLQRMLLISKEAGMSRQRIMASSMVTMLVVVGTVGYGVSAFPLNATAPAVVEPQGTQTPPRDPRRAAVAQESPAERVLKSELDGTNPRKYLDLAKIQEARGALAEAETTLLAGKKAFPDNTTILAALGVFYSRTDQIDKWVATFREAYAVSPTFRPQYANALNHKAAKLEMDAGLDPANRARLQAAASALRQQAQELTPPPPPPSPSYRVREAVKDAPPPPPPSAPLRSPAGTDWPPPVRVGGPIKVPTKVKDVKPLYPEIAQASRVQGVVIIEAMIDPSGRVAEARVLRGQPLLDDAALEAVKGWEFTPTQVEGVAVPVIMTVTVNFSLQP